jgi:methylase of polypeptide subunit release factors
MALFPEAGSDVLHVFSGALPAGPYVRLDLHESRGADIVGNVYDVRAIFGERRFRLIVADTPYTPADCKRYDVPMVNKRRAIAALAEVAAPGAFLAWLDTSWPQHRKSQWKTVGRILIQRSTNHRVRVLTLFERAA